MVVSSPTTCRVHAECSCRLRHPSLEGCRCRSATKFNSTEAIAELVERAKRSFTDLAKTGEGGEMLLFLLAERFLQLPQILCKMDLKTDSRMHYHGADGVYAGVTSSGTLKLFWERVESLQKRGLSHP
jgi:hypothetical protein